MLRFEGFCFGRLASAAENGDDSPYDDWRLYYLFRSGLILIFSIYPDLPGQKVVFFFPASFFSPKQRFFHTSPGILKMTGECAVIETLHSRYTFEIGDHGLTQKDKEDLFTTVRIIMDIGDRQS